MAEPRVHALPMHLDAVTALLARMFLATPALAQAPADSDPAADESLVPEKVARPAETPAPPAEPVKSSYLPDIGSTGFMIYLTPIFGLTYRPKAVPRDELVYGSLSTRAGVVLRGRPYAKWRFVMDATFDGSIGKRAAATPDNTSTEILVQEASLSYLPFGAVTVRVGRMRMPFSPSQSVVIPGQLFPNRPAVTGFFFLNSDDGGVLDVSPLGERLRISLGVFDGSSLVNAATEKKARGIVGSARVLVEPLGAMSGTEGDYERGPFRFALGTGAMFRPGTLFDDTGFGTTRFDETRLLGFARASVRGLFVQGEILRRLLTDDLSQRPRSAWGTYVEATQYVTFGSVGFSPIARVGYHVEDAASSPARTIAFEGGISFLPHALEPEPDALRFTLLYAFENRAPFPDPASSVSAAAALRF